MKYVYFKPPTESNWRFESRFSCISSYCIIVHRWLLFIVSTRRSVEFCGSMFIYPFIAELVSSQFDVHSRIFETDCPATLDIIFVLDLSGSTEDEYNSIIEFARQTATGLDVNSGLVRLGVVTFDYNVTNAIYLNQYIGLQRNFTDALNFIHDEGRTNTQVGYRKTWQHGIPNSSFSLLPLLYGLY